MEVNTEVTKVSIHVFADADVPRKPMNLCSGDEDTDEDRRKRAKFFS